MAGVPSPWWGRGASLTPAFLSSPGGSEGDGVRVCSVQPGAHQVTETGPASSWVLHCLTPGTAGALAAGSLGCLVPSVVSPCQRTLALAAPPAGARLGAEQPSQPRSICHPGWVPAVEHCPQLCPHPCGCPQAAAPSPGRSLALTVPYHVLAQALWPGSVVEEPSFPLVVLPPPPGWGRTTSGLCPYLSQHCAR